MTIIDPDELDKRMGRTIDPNSVPTHNGGDLGAMQGVIARGSEDITTERGAGRRGAAVFSLNEVGPQMSGSGTIVSVSDAPQLHAKMDPTKAPAAPAAPPVVSQPPAGARPRSAQELLAQMGFGKKP